jgi:hypothetical protein
MRKSVVVTQVEVQLLYVAEFVWRDGGKEENLADASRCNDHVRKEHLIKAN